MKEFRALAPVALGAALALTPFDSGRAQVKISSLPSAATLTGAELLPAVQGGGDVTTTPAGLLAYIAGHLTGAVVFGTPTAGHCASWYSATQLQDAGACGGAPGGSVGQIQYDNAGALGGFTMAGDCTISVPNITCPKTNGSAFGYFATGTAASNLTGTIGAAQLPNPTPAALGGVESLAVVSHSYLTSISTLGVPAAARPTCADLSDATAFCNLTATNGVSFLNLAQIAANTVLGNGTGGTANIAALATTGSGSVVEATSPMLVTPVLGVATATSVNALTLTAGATGFQLAGGTTSKTAVFQSSLTFTGTDGTTITFPTTSATIARIDGSQSFNGTQTFTGPIVLNAAMIVKPTAPTAPTITGGTVAVTNNSGSAAQEYTVSGSPSAATIALALPTGTHGWLCDGVDITSGTHLQQTTKSATAPVLTNYTAAGATANFSSGDDLLVKCLGY